LETVPRAALIYFFFKDHFNTTKGNSVACD